jgi:F-type H+-transporting ATPase subunit gamma
MSARQAIQQRLHSLSEIGDILDAMQALAVIETHKLTRFGASQCRVVSGIERAMTDLCCCFPHLLERPQVITEAYLLLGSERGFCGDFNDHLLVVLAKLDREQPAANRVVLAVGSRLFAKLENDSRLVAQLHGANVAEEVPALLGQVVDTLLALEGRFGPLGLTVLCHELETQQIKAHRLLPPFETIGKQLPAAIPPRIHLPVRQLFSELVEHYLFASLHKLFYTALLVENQRRVQHLEAATRRLQEEITRLTLKANALRQEEIIEEIEVILLSAQVKLRQF